MCKLIYFFSLYKQIQHQTFVDDAYIGLSMLTEALVSTVYLWSDGWKRCLKM